MASVYRRSGTQFLWGKWLDAAGVEHRASLETSDEAEARARAAELERLARGGDVPGAAPGELTVEGFVGTPDAPGEWLKLRQVARPLAWRDDLSRLRHHFFKDGFGARPLAWLATDDGGRALFAWAVGLKTHKAMRDGKPLASRSVWNTLYVVKVLLDDAAELKRIDRNPLAAFRADKYLPTKADKCDGWREAAGFELDQVVSLTIDARLLERRRIWNALAFMCGGARTGELANLRWRDWTESYKGGLGRLVIASAYNSRENVEKGTKTGAKKIVPVHPFAGRLLKAWRDEGWKAWMGSTEAPAPEAFIVPQGDGAQQRNWRLLAEFHADLDVLGIPRQRQYENRSTFRNLLLRVGAPEFIVNLMTHPSPKQASDFYTRLEMQWPAMCEAILQLDAPAWREPPRVTATVTEAPPPTVSEAECEEDRQLKQAVGWSRQPELNRRPTVYEGVSFPARRPLHRVATPPSQGRTALAVVDDEIQALPDGASPLPPVTQELFIQAAAIAAQRTPAGGVELLRRGLEQAAALT